MDLHAVLLRVEVVRNESSFASHVPRFGESAFATDDLTDLTGESDLAECNRVVRKRFVAPRRKHRERSGKIRRGFRYAYATDGRHEHVVGAERNIGVTVQNRDEQRESHLIEPDSGAS